MRFTPRSSSRTASAESPPKNLRAISSSKRRSILISSSSCLSHSFAKPSDDRSGKRDRKSTRLNSSHSQISYAVFCLKKKHITIISLNALHTNRQNLFHELDAVIHLLMEAKHWGLRKSRNATSLIIRFNILDTLQVTI